MSLLKILVVSDTHGNHKLLENVLARENEVQYVFHLGDEHTDLDLHPEYLSGKTVVTVAGLYHSDYYSKGRLQKLILQQLPIYLTHVKNNFTINFNEKALYCYGHTHQPILEKAGKCIFLNPGHLKKEMDRGYPASSAIIEFTEKDLSIYIREYNGNIRAELVLKLDPECTE